MHILPQDESAAIFNHYFAQLAKANGLRWTERNQADITRACELLSDAEEPPADEIPPYERPIVSDRVTQVFDREDAREPIAVDPEWEKFQRWRQERAIEERYEQTRRLVRR